MKTLNTIVLSIGMVATASVFTTVRNFDNQKSERHTAKIIHFKLPVSFVNVDTYSGKRNLAETKNENKNKVNFVYNFAEEISSTDFEAGENLLSQYVNQKNKIIMISDSDFTEGENKLKEITNGKFQVRTISESDFKAGEEILIQSIK